MTIADRNLTAGTRLVAAYKGNKYVCRVEEEDGKLVFVLEDGRRFKSPSSAGSAVMGGKAVNGWLFWGLDAEEVLTEQAPAPENKEPTATKGKKLIYRLPNQRGVAEGWIRFWCNGCMKSFLAAAGETSAACPEGHRLDSLELTAG